MKVTVMVFLFVFCFVDNDINPVGFVFVNYYFYKCNSYITSDIITVYVYIYILSLGHTYSLTDKGNIFKLKGKRC